MKYSIFHHTIESNIALPELQRSDNAPPTLFFTSSTISKAPQVGIDWFHHWRLPNGQISISVGKENENYWLRFPHLVDFKLHPGSNNLTSYRHIGVPDNTVTHLLIDQTIPRLLSHQGHFIVHASCVQVGDSEIVFCGESGWGKSTLAAYFYGQGYTLITDDCLLLETKKSSLTGTPSYQGLRLLDDSLSVLTDSQKETTTVCHYASKKRITGFGNSQKQELPISTFFILTDPIQQDTNSLISTKAISRASAIIELIKHCFPLDITDSKRTSKQLENLAQLIKNSKTQFYHLNYPRNIKLLPNVLKTIIQTHNKQTNDTTQ